MKLKTGIAIVAGFGVMMGTLTAVKLSAGVPQAAVLNTIAAGSHGAQIDAAWQVAVADGETATTAPYKPGIAAADANPSTALRMGSFTGVVVRARYETGASMGTDPIVRLWGLKGTSWTALADTAGNFAFTLADTAATDCDDGTYQWTVPSNPIDALGCEAVIVTISTAGVSAGGTIRIEITRY